MEKGEQEVCDGDEVLKIFASNHRYYITSRNAMGENCNSSVKSMVRRCQCTFEIVKLLDKKDFPLLILYMTHYNSQLKMPTVKLWYFLSIQECSPHLHT